MSFQNNFKEIKKVSIIIPIYNEEESLPFLLKRTIIACKKLQCLYEVILVDDGSYDKSTNLIIEAAKNKNNNIIAIILKRNYGQHSAIMAAFKKANGDLIITLDADLQNPPEEIIRLVKIAKNGYDVIGTRRKNRKDSLFRKIASKIINMVIIKYTGHIMGDYGCMLRAYRRNIVNRIIQCNIRNTFIPLLANTFAKKMIEIEVSHVEREFGYSKYNFLKLINLMFDLLICSNTVPLRLLSIFSSVILLIIILLIIICVILYFNSYYIWNTFTTFFLLFFFFIFIITEFINLLLLNKYINKFHNSISNNPNFFIKKIISFNQIKYKNKEK